MADFVFECKLLLVRMGVRVSFPEEGKFFPEWEEEVEALDDAIDLFLRKRNEWRYGNDFWPQDT